MRAPDADAAQPIAQVGSIAVEGDSKALVIVKSASLKFALNQKGLPPLARNVCLRVYEKKMSPEQALRLRFPAEVPFLREVIPQRTTQVGSLLKILHPALLKVAESCISKDKPDRRQLMTTHPAQQELKMNLKKSS